MTGRCLCKTEHVKLPVTARILPQQEANIEMLSVQTVGAHAGIDLSFLTQSYFYVYVFVYVYAHVYMHVYVYVYVVTSIHMS